MTDLEQLLLNAADEIQQLRRRNEVLNAKVDTMNLFATVLNTQPAYSPEGASPDIAWILLRKAEEIKNAEVVKPKLEE